jgi:hypothetical protein
MSSKQELTVWQEIQMLSRKFLKENWKYIIIYYIVGVASFKFGLWLQGQTDKTSFNWFTPKFVRH